MHALDTGAKEAYSEKEDGTLRFSREGVDEFRVNARKARSEVPPTLASNKARHRYAAVTLSEAVFLQVSQSAGGISSVKSRN